MPAGFAAAFLGAFDDDEGPPTRTRVRTTWCVDARVPRDYVRTSGA